MGSDAGAVGGVVEFGDFNPRSPDGERLNLAVNDFGYAPISIHAPRMGSDNTAHARRRRIS